MSMKNSFYHLIVFSLLLGLVSSARASQQKGYSIEEIVLFQQINSSSTVTGYSPLGYAEYDINAKVDTGGASLSAAPILGLPSTTSAYPGGSATFPTGTNFSPTLPTGSGYNQYWVDVAGGNNLASVSAASGSGTFTFTLGNATAQPTLSLNTANSAFPSTPMLTSGGTWSGSTLLLDPAATNVLTFNTGSFTTYTNGLGGAVSYNLLDPSGTVIIPKAQSVYAPSVGLTQPVLTSFAIAPGTLVNGSNYIVQAGYKQIENLNTIYPRINNSTCLSSPIMLCGQYATGICPRQPTNGGVIAGVAQASAPGSGIASRPAVSRHRVKSGRLHNPPNRPGPPGASFYRPSVD